VLMPGGMIYLVELKKVGGEVRPAQKVWHARALRRGVVVVVLYGADAVRAWVRSLESGELK
jgi:hypothetical protein